MQPVDVCEDLAVVALGVDPGRDGPEDEDQQEIEAEQRELGCRPRAVEVEEEARVRDDGEGEEVGRELLRVDVRREGGPPGEVEGVDPRRGRGTEGVASAVVGPYPRGPVLPPPPLPLPRPIDRRQGRVRSDESGPPFLSSLQRAGRVPARC